MTIQAIINDVILAEGGDMVTHVAGDRGGWTKFGVTAHTLGKWRQLGRDATEQEVRGLQRSEAEDIYRQRYVDDPGFNRVPGERLRAQLVDFGVNSGPHRAITCLQQAMGLPKKYQTGFLGPVTMSALVNHPEVLVNNALVAARCKFIDDWTDNAVSQKKFEEGVESRALKFYIAGE